MFDPQSLRSRFEALPGVRRFIVAYSGGLDSTVLLHALTRLRAPANIVVEVAHVHHGLHTEADRWLEHCAGVCKRLDVPCRVFWVDAHPKAGESPEAAARAARYDVLRSLVRAGTCLITAHHGDDQSETVLLQLLRGSGSEGLAAMPFVAEFADGYHMRPLLEHSRTDLLRYAQDHDLDWIEDPSNFDVDYDRNFVRRELFPLLRRRWPSVAQTLCRVARIQAESCELAFALGEIDRGTADGSRPGTLSVNALKRFSNARRNNLLRHWIRERSLPVLTSRQLARVGPDLLASRPDSTPCLRWAGGEMRRYRDDLYALSPLPSHDPSRIYSWIPERDLSLPHLGLRLTNDKMKLQGLQVSSSEERVEVRFRRGGERCRRKGRRHCHALKKLFQEAGIPPWERDRIPLVYVNDQLILVWGHWICK
jgi:tRNA(Ile)-lysidine synthase